MELDEQDKSARKKHTVAINKGKTCIDCHKGLVHDLPDEEEEEEPVQTKSLIQRQEEPEEEEDDEKDEKRESFSGFSIQVRNQSTLTPELEVEFKNILEAYGFNSDVLSQAEITPRTIQDVDLAPAIDIELDTFDWGQALRTELEWLQSNNVISGLTDDDIYGIGKVADKGTAGGNSKIRYFKGKWVQGITEEMSEETGIYMLRAGIDCGGFPAGLLPEEVLRGVPAPYESVPDNQLPFFGVVTIAYHEKALTVGVIVIIALLVGIGGFVF